MGGAGRSKIFVYNGYGSSRVSTNLFLEALKGAVDHRTHCVEPISAEEIKTGQWSSSCRLLAIGGGFDLGFIKALGPEGVARIRQYVHEGGSYLGMCAGAYFASSRIAFDKGGPLEVTGERDLQFFPGSCVGPVFSDFDYNSRSGAHALPLLYEGSLQLQAYYEGGGFFLPDGDPETVRVLAMYLVKHQGAKPHSQSISGSTSSTLCNGMTKSDIPLGKANESLTFKEELSTNFSLLLQSPIDNNMHCDHSPHSNLSTFHTPLSSSSSASPSPSMTSSSAKSSHSSSTSFQATSDTSQENLASIVQCEVGEGRAILSSLHLEFPTHLLDDTDPHLKHLIPTFALSERRRDVVFKDLLRRLGVKVMLSHGASASHL